GGPEPAGELREHPGGRGPPHARAARPARAAALRRRARAGGPHALDRSIAVVAASRRWYEISRRECGAYGAGFPARGAGPRAPRHPGVLPAAGAGRAAAGAARRGRRVAVAAVLRAARAPLRRARAGPPGLRALRRARVARARAGPRVPLPGPAG